MSCSGRSLEPAAAGRNRSIAATPAAPAATTCADVRTVMPPMAMTGTPREAAGGREPLEAQQRRRLRLRARGEHRPDDHVVNRAHVTDRGGRVARHADRKAGRYDPARSIGRHRSLAEVHASGAAADRNVEAIVDDDPRASPDGSDHAIDQIGQDARPEITLAYLDPVHAGIGSLGCLSNQSLQYRVAGGIDRETLGQPSPIGDQTQNWTGVHVARDHRRSVGGARPG